MEQSIRPFKSLTENEIMVKAYHAIANTSAEATTVLAEVGIRYAALRAKVEQYEKDQGLFAEWLYRNRWFRFENDKWYYTFEMGTSMSDKTYEKNYVKTTSELFASYQKESGVSLKKEPVPQGPATTVLVPCSEDDPRAVGGYTSYDGRSLCHVRESEVPVIEGAVWVKARQFKFEVGIAYHAKDSKSKGAGHFDDFGNFFWIDHNMTPGDSQDDLLILDEGTGKEPCKPTGTCQGENGTCIDWYACERNNGCKWPVKEVKL